MSASEQGEMTTLHAATTKGPVTINAITDSPSTLSIDKTTTTENQMETSSTPGKVTTTASGSGSGHKDHTTSADPNEIITTASVSGSGHGDHTTSTEPEETSAPTTGTEQTTSAQPEDTTYVDTTSVHATTEGKLQTTSETLKETTSDDRTTDTDHTSAQPQATTSESRTTNMDRSTTEATAVKQDQTTTVEVQSTETSLIVEETTTTGILSTPETNDTCPQCLCMCSCKAEPPAYMTTPNWTHRPNSTTVAENLTKTTMQDEIETTETSLGTTTEIESTTTEQKPSTIEETTTSKTTQQSTNEATTGNLDPTVTPMCTCVEDLASELQELFTTLHNTTEMQQCLRPISKETVTDQQTTTSEDVVTTSMHKTSTDDDGMNITGCPICTCDADLTTDAMKNPATTDQGTTTKEDETTTSRHSTASSEVTNVTGCPMYTCPTVMPCSCPTQGTGSDNKCPVYTCPTVTVPPCPTPNQFIGTDGEVYTTESTTTESIPVTTDEENIMTTESLKVKHKLTRKAFVKMIKEFREMIDDTADSCPVPCPKAECNATSENKSQPATTPESPAFDATSCPECKCKCDKNEAQPTVTTREMTTELTTNQTDMFTTAGKKEFYTIKKKKRPVIVHEPLDLTDVKRAEEADYGPMIGSCFLVIVLAEVAFMVFLDLISIKMHIDMIKQNLGLVQNQMYQTYWITLEGDYMNNGMAFEK